MSYLNHLLLVCSLATLGLGWDTDSHKIVAKLAAGLLTRKAARFVTLHLKDGKSKSTKMTRLEHEMVSVAGWADFVKRTTGMEYTANFHFADTPYRACDRFVLERDCRKDGCIVTAIPDYVKQASDVSVSGKVRSEAIKFLIHLIADIHNPMHIGFAEDFGGNAILVGTPAATDQLSLHKVWDTLLIDRLKQKSDWWEVVRANDPLTDDDIALYSSFHLDAGSLTDYSSQIASETAIEVTCPYGYQLRNKPRAWIKHRGTTLSSEYLKSRTNVAVVQLKKSAVRLAQVLEFVAQLYHENQSLTKHIALPIKAHSTPVNAYSHLFSDDDEDEFFDDDDLTMDAGESFDAYDLKTDGESFDADTLKMDGWSDSSDSLTTKGDSFDADAIKMAGWSIDSEVIATKGDSFDTDDLKKYREALYPEDPTTSGESVDSSEPSTVGEDPDLPAVASKLRNVVSKKRMSKKKRGVKNPDPPI